MTVLEMMKQDINSVVGLTVEYYYGGSKPIVDVVTNAKVVEQPVTVDGEPSTVQIYLISFNGGLSYYTVDKFTKVRDFDRA
jgi:hypothetical protein